MPHSARASHRSHGDWHRVGASLQRCFEPPCAGEADSQQCWHRCRGEPLHAIVRPLHRVVSLAHSDTVDRFLPTLLLPFSARLSFCWITGCCFGGSATKRWTGTGFGRICDGSAAGCLQTAWRKSLCFPLTCSQLPFLGIQLNPASLAVNIMNAIPHLILYLLGLILCTPSSCCASSTP